MKPLIAITIAMMFTVSASAQSVVVLKMGTPATTAFGAPDANGRVTLTLASGARITVPLSDLDVDLTRSVGSQRATTTTEPLPPPPPNAAAGITDAYRIARCRELMRSPTLVPAATRDQELRDLQCGAVTAAMPSAAETLTGTDPIIRSKCAKDWPTDFSVRAFCEKTQREAVGKINQRRMTTPDERTIRTKCAADWPDDFGVRNFCEEQQLKALQQLGR